jgi:hypothetical protein
MNAWNPALFCDFCNPSNDLSIGFGCRSKLNRRDLLWENFWPLIKLEAYACSIMEVFGGLFVLLWFVYGILIFFIPFILYAIMSNTKRSADLLAQILLVQVKNFKEPSSDPGSIDSPPPAPVPLEPTRTREPLKFTTLKLGSTYNNTDEGLNPGPEKDGNGPLHPEEPRSD